MSFAAKRKKKHIQNQRQTNTSHCPTKTIAKSVACPLKRPVMTDAPPPVASHIRSQRLRWAGHVARMENDSIIKGLETGLPEGTRPVGRPP